MVVPASRGAVASDVDVRWTMSIKMSVGVELVCTDELSLSEECSWSQQQLFRKSRKKSDKVSSHVVKPDCQIGPDRGEATMDHHDPMKVGCDGLFSKIGSQARHRDFRSCKDLQR